MTERRDDEQRRRDDEEADAALASAGAAAGPAAGEEAEAPEEVVEVPDLPGGAPAGGEESATGEEPVEADLDELRGEAARAGEYLALAQRTKADFENFRRRAQRDVAAAEARGVAKLARELLPAIDNLERALASAEAAGAAAGGGGQEHHLTEGIRLVQAELSAALGRIGIEGFTPKGEQFDPNVHEAMAQTPVEGAASGTIVEVYQPGYRLADQVLRPARVVVAA